MSEPVIQSRIWPRWLRVWFCGRKGHPGVTPYMRHAASRFNVVAKCHRCREWVQL